MPIEAVVFDIGGVLEVNPRTGWQARWAASLGLEPAAFERRLDEIFAPGSVGAVSLEAIERQTAEEFDLDDAALRALMEDGWAEYVGTLNHQLAEYLAQLRPRFRTGILSNSFVGAREREEARYGFSGMCDAIVYSHEAGCMKPDPRMYRMVCERLEVSPPAAVLLDDVAENVEGALTVGMRAVTFCDNGQAISELEALLGE